MRLPLTAQVLILVVTPLLFQLGSLIWLSALQEEAETELKRATRANKISAVVTQLSNDVFYAAMYYGSEERDFRMPDSSVLTDLTAKLKGHYRELNELTRDNAEQHALVVEAENAGRQTMRLLSQIDVSMKRSEEGEHDMRKALWKRLHNSSRNLLSSELLSMARKEKRYADESPEVQAHIRQNMQQAMLLAGGANLVIALFAATYLTQSITGRIRRLNENTYRLASDLPLHPALPGDDELARLDRVFHDMARDLKEARRKERALIDNARDLICSINDSGKISAINPYIEELCGYGRDDLLMTAAVDLVEPSSMADFLNQLDGIKEGREGSRFETRLKHADGRILDVVASAHYAAEDQSIFLVVHDITERKEAERLRQEVVAMVTHDLRTPLNTVSNIFEFLEGGSLGELSEKGNKFVKSGIRNLGRMTSLVNDLLDIEKYRAGSMELIKEEFDLYESLNACRDLHLSILEEEKIEVAIAKTERKIIADREKFERLLGNLLANAIKFSESGGKIDILVEDSDSAALTITVADHGPGIAEDLLERVFDRFFQAGTTSVRKTVGSGLGLAIARSIADAHGFTLWVESRPGEGCRFKLSIA
ncbi:MAG: ATP-binding protein [Cyanobacteriota/Melainabacteria group bacterium]